MIDSPATDLSLDANAPGYERERRAAVLALADGRLQDARDHFQAAFVAASQGPRETSDRALCNLAAIAITLGDPEAPVGRLREVLLRSESMETRFLAAYNISRAYEAKKDHRKALFYGDIARKRAEEMGDRERLAAAQNRIANSLVADSVFDQAAATYREAIALLPGGDSDNRALICEANLAYCEIVTGEQRSGLVRLWRVLRAARRTGSRRLEMIARIDLCFAHLELERYASAERHGLRGLDLAEEIGEIDWIKNGLYLLGETAVLDGREDEARERFAALQRRFYPTQTYLPEFLVTVDVRKLVNLRA